MEYKGNFLWLVAALVCLPSQTVPYEIYGVDLARRLSTISKDGLGQGEIQVRHNVTDALY